MSTQNTHTGHILVDLDGTLAHYDQWRGVEHIGEPVKPMLDRVKKMLSEGKDVRIFTARVFPLIEFEGVSSLDNITPSEFNGTGEAGDRVLAGLYIREWCKKHIGRALPITCRKDFHTTEIYDDRAFGVLKNRGITSEALIASLLYRVLLAAGVEVKNGMEYATASEFAESRIRLLVKNCEDALAHVDSAADALGYIKGSVDNDDSRNLKQARVSLSKALIAMKQVAKE